ncbi:MAG: tetratricopeptide repeat protein, partial [Cyanobacteria bacterium]|nr:tetratricopeptide repeat protein [Cyanobacteriota bacterium]
MFAIKKATQGTIACLLILLTAAEFGFARVESAQVLLVLDKGDILMMDGRVRAALGLFKKAMATDETSIKAINKCSQACRTLGGYDDALQYATKGLIINANDESCMDEKGESLLGAKRFQEAYQWSIAELKKHPDFNSLYTYSVRGMSGWKSEKHGALLGNELITNAPKKYKSAAYIGIGNYNEVLAKTRKAVECYKTALQLDKTASDAFLGLGRCYMKLKKFKDAEDCYLNALKADNRHISREEIYLYCLGSMYSETKDYEKALAYLSEAEKFGSQHHLVNTIKRIQVLSARGDARAASKDYQSALKDYDAVLGICTASSIKPNTGLLERKIEILKIQKKDKEAMNAIKQAHGWYPNDARYAFIKGMLQFDKRDFFAAIDTFTKAIESSPSNASYYNQRGLAYGKIGNLKACLADFSKAADLV